MVTARTRCDRIQPTPCQPSVGLSSSSAVRSAWRAAPMTVARQLVQPLLPVNAMSLGEIRADLKSYEPKFVHEVVTQAAVEVFDKRVLHGITGPKLVSPLARRGKFAAEPLPQCSRRGHRASNPATPARNPEQHDTFKPIAIQSQTVCAKRPLYCSGLFRARRFRPPLRSARERGCVCRPFASFLLKRAAADQKAYRFFNDPAYRGSGRSDHCW
jgi:hypothetical protein